MSLVRLSSLLVCFLILVGSAPADDKPALKDYAPKLVGRHAYGLYARGPMKDHKVGWMIIELKLGKHDGKDVLISSQEHRMETKEEGELVRTDSKETSIYSLTGDGDLLIQEERNDDGKRASVWRGVRRDDQFIITLSTDPKGRQRKVAPPKMNLRETRQRDDWLRSGPKKDATFVAWSFTFEENDVNVKEEYVFQSKKVMKIDGRDRDVFQVRYKYKGAWIDAEMFADGTWVKGKVGILDFRLEAEAVARKLDDPVDLTQLASIPIDKDLGDADEVEALTLSVTGLEDYPLPTSHRQQLRKGDKNPSVLLVLKRDFKPEKAEQLTDSQRKALLAATPRIQCNEPKVKEQLRKIIGEETDVNKRARLLSKWVYTKIKKTYSEDPQTTLEVLERLSGDCKHHTLLFVALARAAGIPAREVTGVGYNGAGTKSFGWHAWAEYHDGHHWVSVDPTWGQERVDATHIKFSDSVEDMSHVNVEGKVKFKLVEVKKSSQKDP